MRADKIARLLHLREVRLRHAEAGLRRVQDGLRDAELLRRAAAVESDARVRARDAACALGYAEMRGGPMAVQRLDRFRDDVERLSESCAVAAAAEVEAEAAVEAARVAETEARGLAVAAMAELRKWEALHNRARAFEARAARVRQDAEDEDMGAACRVGRL